MCKCNTGKWIGRQLLLEWVSGLKLARYWPKVITALCHIYIKKCNSDKYDLYDAAWDKVM